MSPRCNMADVTSNQQKASPHLELGVQRRKSSPVEHKLESRKLKLALVPSEDGSKVKLSAEDEHGLAHLNNDSASEAMSASGTWRKLTPSQYLDTRIKTVQRELDGLEKAKQEMKRGSQADLGKANLQPVSDSTEVIQSDGATEVLSQSGAWRELAEKEKVFVRQTSLDKHNNVAVDDVRSESGGTEVLSQSGAWRKVTPQVIKHKGIDDTQSESGLTEVLSQSGTWRKVAQSDEKATRKFLAQKDQILAITETRPEAAQKYKASDSAVSEVGTETEVEYQPGSWKKLDSNDKKATMRSCDSATEVMSESGTFRNISPEEAERLRDIEQKASGRKSDLADASPKSRTSFRNAPNRCVRFDLDDPLVDKEMNCLSWGFDEKGAYVTRISDEAPLCITRDAFVGDRLLAINRKSTDGLNRAEILKLWDDKQTESRYLVLSLTSFACMDH